MGGSAFKRWSELRFVASAGSWTLLERVRSLSDSSDQRAAVIRGPQGEQTLSAGHALGITATLGTLGLRTTDVDRAAEEIVAVAYPNPRLASADDVRQILVAAL